MNTNRPPGNHVAIIEALARQTPLAPGSVWQAIVEHDASCPIFAGRPCDCSPAVKLVPCVDPQAN